jgi:tetratricopeptide (TPR) repeat protein
MQRWILCAFLCVGLWAATAVGQVQKDEAAKANELYETGKKLDALPLYEDLVKSHPDEVVYQGRLAGCLDAALLQATDQTQLRALAGRMRDAAKRAVELGDKSNVMQMLASVDPDEATVPSPSSPAAKLLQEAEKAFTAGDFDTAMKKYEAAADADPKLYEAALYAGDTAYTQRDLATAAKWFERAIAIDQNRETAYRYWGDAIMQAGKDPEVAREKFIDAIVAEPYSKFAWQGLQQWAVIEKAVILAPKIDRPAGPVVDPKKPNTTNITIDVGSLDEKKNPKGFAWMMYPLIRAGYEGDVFKRDFPNEKEYRHTLKEEDAALSAVATTIAEKKFKKDKLDESLRNLMDVYNAGMLDCWILINGADEGIAQDYAAYRDQHRQLMHDYIAHFVIHGGVNPEQ